MKAYSSQALLTSGPIGPALISLSGPMLAGILSMMAFNVIDAFFIGKLGAGPLAAITLTFPVAAIISTCTIGLGVGAMAAIAKSIGSGDHSRIGRLTTDTLSLSMLLVAVLCIAGIVLINPIFTMLGASPELLPEIRRYMYLWYPGMMLYTVPMISSNILRATGDTITPSAIMIGSMVVNALLDPLFIFGLGPIPALGLAGAATASLITRALALCFALWLLWHREHLIVNPLAHKHELLESWKTVLVIGMPVAISNMIIPAATGVITAIVTRFGTEAVAGFGVGTRTKPFCGAELWSRKIRPHTHWRTVCADIFFYMGHGDVCCAVVCRFVMCADVQRQFGSCSFGPAVSAYCAAEFGAAGHTSDCVDIA